MIDVAEYSRSDGQARAIDYFQLKHSTVRTHLRIGFAELKKTLKGFVARYKAALREPSYDHGRITFSVVTNRRISQSVKDTLNRITTGHNANPKLQRQLQNLTRLRGPKLQHFCAALRFIDGEGDYIVQKERLHSELTEYIAGFVDSDEIDTSSHSFRIAHYLSRTPEKFIAKMFLVGYEFRQNGTFFRLLHALSRCKTRFAVNSTRKFSS